MLQTWCLDPLLNWPNEYLKCDINLGLSAGPLDKLPLIYSDNLAHQTIDSLSEWYLHKVSVTPIAKGITARYTDKSVMQSMDGDISIIFEISRNSSFYKNVFSIPILGMFLLYFFHKENNIIFLFFYIPLYFLRSLSSFNNSIIFIKRLSSWCINIGGHFNFNVRTHVPNQTCTHCLCARFK